jgi:cytochrome c
MRAAAHLRLLGLAVLLLGAPLAGQASAFLASEMGCYNCHGQPPRGDAPTMERLATRLAGRQGDAKALQHAVDELLRGEPLQRIPAHERLSPETAQMLIRWLAEGGR